MDGGVMVIVILLFTAGCLNGLMDTIAHHPQQLNWIKGKLGQWVRGEYRIAGDWMIGVLYVLKDFWHSVKIAYQLTIFIAIMINNNYEPIWFWFIIIALSHWVGFLFIYKGLFGTK